MPYHYEEKLARFDLALRLFLLVGLMALIAVLAASSAHAASLRICFTDDTSPDVATAPAFINGNPLAPDLLPGSTLTGTKRCNVAPIPATLVRGASATVTMKYANAVGEVSAPSNGLSFRNPALPPVPVITDVSVVAP